MTKRGFTALALVGAAHLAHATPVTPRAEWQLWEAKLQESAFGGFDSAIVQYQELARRLDDAEEAPLRVRVLLSLGRTLHLSGQLEEARRAYDACRRLSTSGLTHIDTTACAAGSRQVALEQGAIRTLPTRWTFEEGTHGFVLLAERGSMSAEVRGNDPYLVWSQEVSGPQIADLMVSLDLAAGRPRGVRLVLRSENDNALLEFIAEDDLGHAYALSGKLFRTDDQLRTWEISLADLEPLDPSWPALDPSTLATLRLRDSTGFQLPELRTRHRILLREFSLY